MDYKTIELRGMATFGTIGEFVGENESITAYLERVGLFMDANGVKDEKQVSTLLSVIGGKTYGLLRSLLSPDVPSSKDFGTLVGTLKAHFEPKPILIAERFHFHKRNQAPGESIGDYIAELKRMSATCDFRGYLEEALRDRFVGGPKSQVIQKRLLAEADLTFRRAAKIALGIEAAERNSQQLKGVADTGSIQQLNKSSFSHKYSKYRKSQKSHSEGSCSGVERLGIKLSNAVTKILFVISVIRKDIWPRCVGQRLATHIKSLQLQRWTTLVPQRKSLHSSRLVVTPMVQCILRSHWMVSLWTWS